MSVRAKFYVRAVELQSYDPDAALVKLQAVKRKEGDSEAFFKATPSGSIEMSISNPEAAKFFRERLGRDFYVDFTEADPLVRSDAYQQDPAPEPVS